MTIESFLQTSLVGKFLYITVREYAKPYKVYKGICTSIEVDDGMDEGNWYVIVLNDGEFRIPDSHADFEIVG